MVSFIFLLKDKIMVLVFDNKDIKTLVQRVVHDKKIRKLTVGFLESNAKCNGDLTCGFYDIITNHSYAVTKETVDMDEMEREILRSSIITFKFCVRDKALHIKNNDAATHVIDDVLKNELYDYVKSVVHFEDKEICDELKEALKAVVREFLIVIPHSLEEKVSYNSLRLTINLTVDGILEVY